MAEGCGTLDQSDPPANSDSAPRQYYQSAPRTERRRKVERSEKDAYKNLQFAPETFRFPRNSTLVTLIYFSITS